MFVDFKGTVRGLIRWQWKPVLTFTIAAALVSVLHFVFPEFFSHIDLPSLPLAVVGGALGIFVSFRTNSAYDRWWEGRKLWGRMVNVSRHFASQVLVYAGPERGEALVRRQVRYVHTLRVLLRQEKVTEDKELLRLASADELQDLAQETNATYALLHQHMSDVAQFNREGLIDDFRLQGLDESVREMLAVQGGCERIKKTPFPRSYGFIAERLIWAYSGLLPLALVETMGWWSIPINVLVCTAFVLISETGRVLEDPFTTFWPALPLMALSYTIERDLRARLGDTDLPAAPTPDANGVLM